MLHNIAQILQQDHERLDRMLEDSAQAVKDERWTDAATALENFRQGIVDGHMAVEESLPLPAFVAWEAGEHALDHLHSGPEAIEALQAWIQRYDVQCMRCSD
jgi:TolA-binding protein